MEGCFPMVMELFRGFDVNLMATDVPMQHIPSTVVGATARLPFFSQYAWLGFGGTSNLEQNTAREPGLCRQSFRCIRL